MNNNNNNVIYLDKVILSNLNYEGNKTVLSYYLEKNLTTIFGKTTFEFPKEIDIMNFSNNGKSNQVITIGGKEYHFIQKDESTLEFKSDSEPIFFQITNKNGVMSNFLATVDEEENRVIEKQNTTFGDDEFYDYTKVIKNKNDEIVYEYPAMRLRNIHAKTSRNKENYELITLDSNPKEKTNFLAKFKNKLKSNIVSIPLHDEALPYENVAEVYSVLENQVNQVQHTRK